MSAPMTVGVRLPLALVVAFAPPVAALLLLHPEGPAAIIIVYVAVALLLAGAGKAARRSRARAASALLAVWLGLGAFVVFAGLDITPASTIVAWLAVAHAGAASGVISYLFVTIIALFSSLFGSLLLRRPDPLFILAEALVMALFLAGIITGRILLIAASPLAVGVAFVFRASSAAGAARAGVRPSLQLFAIVLGLAGLLYLAKPENALFEAPFAIDLKPLVARLFPNFPFLYGLPGYGYSFPGESFGDRPALTKRPVFEVTARPGETLYLRTAVYDTYTGSGWQASEPLQEAGRKVAESLAETSRGRTTYIEPGRTSASAALPGTEVAGEPRRRRSAPNTSGPPPVEGNSAGSVARVTLLVDFFPALPSTLDAGSFVVERTSLPPGERSEAARELPGPTGSLPEEDLSGRLELSEAGLATGFLLKSPLLAGSVVTIERAEPTAEAFPGGGTAEPTDRSAYSDAAFGPDLPDLTTDLHVEKPPAQLVSLADELSRGRGKAETIEAIKRYLARCCTYSLDTSGPPPGRDMVANFLFRTHKGYCVQFATSMVILARLAGIPARYVTGFLVNLPEGSERTVVTGMSAHAWAEIWLDGRWRTVEATPPMEPSSFGDPDYYRRFDRSGDLYTLRQLETAMRARVAASTERRPPVRGLPVLLLAVPAAAVLLAALALALRALLLVFQPPPAKARRRVRRLIDLSIRRTLPDPARSGWREWTAATEAALARESGARRFHVERTGRIILQLFFGARRASRRDLRFLTAVSRGVARLPKRKKTRGR